MSCLFLMIFHDRILSMIEILLKVEILQLLLLGSYESRVSGIHSRIYPSQPSITVTTCWTTSKTNLWVIEDCLKGGKCCFGGRVQHFEVLRVFGPKNWPKIHSANKCQKIFIYIYIQYIYSVYMYMYICVFVYIGPFRCVAFFPQRTCCSSRTCFVSSNSHPRLMMFSVIQRRRNMASTRKGGSMV